MKPLAPNISPLLTNNNLLYQKDFLRIYYNTINHWVYADWVGYQTTETIKTGAELLLKAVAETQSYKLINDNTNLTGMKANAVEWLSKDFSPRLYKAGLQYLAWIYKTRSLSEPSADDVIAQSKSDIIVIVFDNVATAETWLKSVY